MTVLEINSPRAVSVIDGWLVSQRRTGFELPLRSTLHVVPPRLLDDLESVLTQLGLPVRHVRDCYGNVLHLESHAFDADTEARAKAAFTAEITRYLRGSVPRTWLGGRAGAGLAISAQPVCVVVPRGTSEFKWVVQYFHRAGFELPIVDVRRVQVRALPLSLLCCRSCLSKRLSGWMWGSSAQKWSAVVQYVGSDIVRRRILDCNAVVAAACRVVYS